MLASVLDAREAAIAVEIGADLIDLKDARRGALGALPIGTVEEAVDAIAGRAPASATLGDPPYVVDDLIARARALRRVGVRYVKFAVDGALLARERGPLVELAKDVSLIGMQFADAMPDLDLVPTLAALGFKGAMIDTRGKGDGGLLAHWDVERATRFCALCRQAGLISGLAGSLRGEMIAPLLAARPDVLGFRGALCAGHARADALDRDAARAVRALIPRPNDQTSVRASAKA